MKKKKNEIATFQSFGASPDLQNELINSTPRAAVIVGATAIEIQLGRLLEAFLISDLSEVNKLIDSENMNAPLGTFSSKIRACYCLGLIAKNEYEDLLKIKEIRNIFAHHISDCTFNEPYIKTICDQFKIMSQMQGSSIIPTREKFTLLIYALDNVIRFRTNNIQNHKRIIPQEMNYR